MDNFFDVANRALPARSNMITTLAALRLKHYEPLPGTNIVCGTSRQKNQRKDQAHRTLCLRSL